LKKLLIIIVLFLISLFPEIIGLDFTLELRPLVFAVLVSSLILEIRWMLFSASLFKRLRDNFCSLDFAYAGCVLLTVISLFLVSQNVKAFHYVFFAVGMFCVYLYFRAKTQKCKEEKIDSSFQWDPSPDIRRIWLCYVIVVISFINATIGLCHFLCGKEVIGTFARTSYFGCYLAMNAPITFGLVLANWKRKNLTYQFSVISSRFLKSFSLLTLVLIVGVVFLTKSRSAIVGLGIVLPLMLVRLKDRKVKKLKGKHSPKSSFKRKLLTFALIIFFVVLAFICGKILYKLKPMCCWPDFNLADFSGNVFKKSYYRRGLRKFCKSI